MILMARCKDKAGRERLRQWPVSERYCLTEARVILRKVKSRIVSVVLRTDYDREPYLTWGIKAGLFYDIKGITQ